MSNATVETKNEYIEILKTEKYEFHLKNYIRKSEAQQWGVFRLIEMITSAEVKVVQWFAGKMDWMWNRSAVVVGQKRGRRRWTSATRSGSWFITRATCLTAEQLLELLQLFECVWVHWRVNASRTGLQV